MSRNRTLEVRYHGRAVGTLAETPDHRIAFSYAGSWLDDGFPISPFSLPLREGVYIPKKDHFGGLFGVFADSLPDAWGQLLLQRILLKQGIASSDIGMLDRLAIIGESGMGALTYHPIWNRPKDLMGYDLDQMARDCADVLKSREVEHLDELFQLGGSSGGARPKVFLKIEGRDWIIKFPSSVDSPDIGFIEKKYMDCARRCGIDVPETRLFPSKTCRGYFGTVRFDRLIRAGRTERVHMLTAAALLELDFREPNMDYSDLMKLTRILSRDDRDDLLQMYRRMCFNVFAHNRDDHSKNFSYIYDEAEDRWHLSPAYDLTYSNTYWGEHTTTVNRSGVNPGMEDLLSVGRGAGLAERTCRDEAEKIRSAVKPLMLLVKNMGLC